MEQIQTQHSKISTVVPATPRGDENSEHHLSAMDLAMKLHYIRAAYFFINEAAYGFSIYDFKRPMFQLLDQDPKLSGRIRFDESGRPFIKCNDAGVRIAESFRDDTLEEWLGTHGCSLEGGVVHDHVLGPDLGFSPFVFVKFTWFKCGGLCVGLSWPHVLGGAFSAFNFITQWTRILVGLMPPKTLSKPIHNKTESPHNNSVDVNPISVKTATTGGELWLATNDTKMVTHTFHVTAKHLNHLVTSIFPRDQNKTPKTTSYFNILSALVWKHVARIRGDTEPKVVTIITHDDIGPSEFSNNDLVISVVETNVVVGKSDVADLAMLIGEEKKVENAEVENLVEESQGKGDFVVYGAKLTFVDLGKSDMYDVELNGQNPILANCSIYGVGDQGVVLVLPGLEYEGGGGSNGGMVTVSLPEKEIQPLKDKLRGEWSIE